MQAHSKHCDEVCLIGEQLVSNDHHSKRDVTQRISTLRDKLKKLFNLAAIRRTRLEDAVESHQVELFFVRIMNVKKLQYMLFDGKTNMII